MEIWNIIWTAAIASILTAIFIAILTILARWLQLKKYKVVKEMESQTSLEHKKTIDILERKKMAQEYADIIDSMNTNIKISKFGIQGGYGYGKTFLLENIYNTLKLNKKNNVILFKAWERDEYYSPINRLLIQMTKKDIQLSKKNRKALEGIIQADNAFWRMNFLTYTRKYDFLLKAMKDIVNSNKIVYIIIDELDRAQPKDAIEFLEVTNQLFGRINNIILIYSYDKSNLEKIITKHMGVSDSLYLNKFIDFTFEIPAAAREYIRNISNKKEYDKKWFTHLLGFNSIPLPLRAINSLIIQYNYLTLKSNSNIAPMILITMNLYSKIHDFEDKRRATGVKNELEKVVNDICKNEDKNYKDFYKTYLDYSNKKFNFYPCLRWAYNGHNNGQLQIWKFVFGQTFENNFKLNIALDIDNIFQNRTSSMLADLSSLSEEIILCSDNKKNIWSKFQDFIIKHWREYITIASIRKYIDGKKIFVNDGNLNIWDKAFEVLTRSNGPLDLSPEISYLYSHPIYKDILSELTQIDGNYKNANIAIKHILKFNRSILLDSSLEKDYK